MGQGPFVTHHADPSAVRSHKKQLDNKRPFPALSQPQLQSQYSNIYTLAFRRVSRDPTAPTPPFVIYVRVPVVNGPAVGRLKNGPY